MKATNKNIFTNIPDIIPEELFETLFDRETIKIERIVSHGQTTPAGKWYDQVWNEWVLVLQGQALLQYDTGESFHLQTGDYMFIPAHVKHRVEWTAPDVDTIWLAIHFTNAN